MATRIDPSVIWTVNMVVSATELACATIARDDCLRAAGEWRRIRPKEFWDGPDVSGQMRAWGERLEAVKERYEVAVKAFRACQEAPPPARPG